MEKSLNLKCLIILFVESKSGARFYSCLEFILQLKYRLVVCLFNSTNSALIISQEKKIINMVNNMDSFCPGWYFGLGDLKLIAL